MPSVIGLRPDVQANGALGETLDQYLMRVNGNVNWSIQDNLRWLCDRIAEADRFIIVSDPTDLFDRAEDAKDPHGVRNFTFGIEMMVLTFANYAIYEAGGGTWELRPRDVNSRIRAISYVQDHLMHDVNLLVNVRTFWQNNQDLLERVRDDLGRMWIARFQQP